MKEIVIEEYILDNAIDAMQSIFVLRLAANNLGSRSRETAADRQIEFAERLLKWVKNGRVGNAPNWIPNRQGADTDKEKYYYESRSGYLYGQDHKVEACINNDEIAKRIVAFLNQPKNDHSTVAKRPNFEVDAPHPDSTPPRERQQWINGANYAWDNYAITNAPRSTTFDDLPPSESFPTDVEEATWKEFWDAILECAEPEWLKSRFTIKRKL